MPTEDLFTGKKGSESPAESKEHFQYPLLEHEFFLLRNFIYEHFGIYFTNDKKWMLESKLNRLMLEYRFKSFLEYYQHIVQRFYIDQNYTNPDIIELIRAVTNHETYFLREKEAFEIIVSLFEKEYRKTRGNLSQKPVRILSAGCSSGEEVYSTAMWLLENGIRTSQYQILGIDIDPTVLETAHCGVYRPFSFRGFANNRPDGVWEKYFNKVPKTENKQPEEKNDYIVADYLRDNVSFEQINIIDLPGLKQKGNFDIILCRNVLIYFSDESKEIALRNFSQILNAGGYLFLGHSESISHQSEIFQAVNDQSIIFYKRL